MRSSLLKWPFIVVTLLVGSILLHGVPVYGQQGGGPGVPISVEGSLEVLTTDNFPQGIVTTSYFILVDNGPRYELRFNPNPPPKLSSYQRVTIAGRLDGNVLYVDNLIPDPNSTMPLLDGGPVLILLVNLQDTPDPTIPRQQTVEAIKDIMYTGVRSVADLYRQSSYNEVNFAPDGDNNGAPDIFGPFTIDYYAAQGCDYAAWGEAAEDAALRAGIDLGLYRYRLFVLPGQADLPACGWTAAAHIGCGAICRVWLTDGASAAVYAHALGHTLELSHAGVDANNDGVIDSFSDPSDPMSLVDLGWRLFNAPHVKPSWYGLNFGSKIVTRSGGYALDVLDVSPFPEGSQSPRILMIPRPTTDPAAQDYYYLSYRQSAGYDAELNPAFTQGISIHRYNYQENSPSALIQTLTDDASFTDTSGGLLRITQTDHDDDYATVDVLLCASAPPQVYLNPSDRTVAPGGATIYTVVVTNKDSQDCPPTTFELNYSNLPTGITGAISPRSITLNGGLSGAAGLQVTASTGLTSGVYPIEVEAIDSDNAPPSHAAGVKGSGALTVDGDPPTVPTGLQTTADPSARKIELTWTASSDALSSVFVYIVYRNDAEIARIPQTSYSDYSAPQGVNVYQVAAIDLLGNVSSRSPGVERAWNHLPTVTITAPVDGAKFTSDQNIAFSGAATDAEDGNLAYTLRWISSIDGVIGNGASFNRKLSPGNHVIQAQTTDRNGAAGAATATIKVINPSTLTATSLGAEDGWVLESTETSNVGGSIKASDATTKGLLLGDSSKKQQYKSILSFDTSAIPDNAIITSATLRLQRGALTGANPFNSLGSLLADIVNGAFSGDITLETTDFQAPATATGVASLTNVVNNGDWSEGALNAAGLAAINKQTGRTQLRLYFSGDDNNNSVADNLGYYPGEYSAAASRPQLVVNYVIDSAPAVTISAPTNDAQFTPGTTIQFTGAAADAEDGNLTSKLKWISNRDGVIGQGGSFTTAALSVGVHTITATVVDSFGLQGTAAVTIINSANQRPTVAISAPANGGRFSKGAAIAFTGTAADPEDGNVTAGMYWMSSIDGNIGGGGSFTYTGLSVGEHVIRAQATDSGGLTGAATVTITVVNPNTITLTSTGAEDGWVLESTETSNIGGSSKATDSTAKGLLLGDLKSDQQYKAIVSFDTSGIPANAIIVSAKLRLQRGTLSGTSPFSTHGALWADVASGAFNGNAALENADFQAPATAEKVTSLSGAASNGAWSEGTLDSNGLAAINRAGRTQFRLYFNLDDNDDGGDDYLGYYAGEYSTATSRPQLVVTFY